MNDIFTNQIVKIEIEQKRSFNDADSVRIDYWRPGHDEDDAPDGFWVATVEGLNIVYTTNSTDLNVSGDWSWQAVATYPEGEKPGKKVYKTVKDR